jgi:hypothetical protein
VARLGGLLGAAAAGLAVAVLVAGAGRAGGVHGVPLVPAVVTPAVGMPATTFVVSFVSPVRTGVVGSIRLRYLLTAASASPGKDCLARISSPVPDGRRGRRVRVLLKPETLGGRWCTGTYGGKVPLLQTAVCPRGAACPTYVLKRGTVTRFSLFVRAPSPPPGGDLVPPEFAGLERAFACTPGPQRPGQTTPYALSWEEAGDNVTPGSAIVYDIYYATTAGREDFTHPTWTSLPGVTSFRTPGLPSHRDAYFVVRARDTAGNEDTNTHEQRGTDPCL